MATSLSPKLLKRFYEGLVLLRVLSQIQGDKIRAEASESGNLEGLGDAEMRRRVMRHLCIMCDFRKGGDTVTAMAAEQLPPGPCYWVAANGFLPKIREFLTDILNILNTRAASSTQDEETSTFEDRLFEIFVPFQRERIKQYARLLQSGVKNELQRIEETPDVHPDAAGYTRWLEAFQGDLQETGDLCALSQLAYGTRQSKFLRTGFDPIFGKPVSMENLSRETIRHCVGRLCAPRRAARLLAFASTSHAELFLDFTIRCQSAGNASNPPPTYQGLTLEGISGRMISNSPAKLQAVREALQTLENMGSITTRIWQQYQSKDWKPRPHAELTLLEALHDGKCTFYNDDKYIACSKAACFCCYHYICSHPGAFSRPSCHNKVYLNWQPPDVAAAGTESRILRQRDVMNGLIQQVRQAVIARVLDKQHKIKWHPDSSTGITPSLHPEVEPGISHSMGGLSLRSSANRSLGSSNFPESDLEHDSGVESEDGGVALPLEGL